MYNCYTYICIILLCSNAIVSKDQPRVCMEALCAVLSIIIMYYLLFWCFQYFCCYIYVHTYDLIYILQVYVFSSISFLSFPYVGTAGIMANFFLRHNIFLSKFFMFFCCHLFWWKLLVAIFIIYLYYTTFFYLLKNTYMYMYLCSSKNLCRWIFLKSFFSQTTLYIFLILFYLF